jgi:hypothetical protein
LAGRTTGPQLRRNAQVVEEARRLVAVGFGRGDGGDDQALAGSRDGDVEQASLLGKQSRAGQCLGEASGTEPVSLEQRAARTHVGPGTLLNTGHHDELPLQTLGPVSREQPNSLAADASLGQRVRRDLLGLDLVEEDQDSGVILLLLGTGGHLEQGTHGVKVAVRCSSRGPATVNLAAKPPWPRSARPQRPQCLLRPDAGGKLSVNRGDQPRELPEAPSKRILDPQEKRGIDKPLPKQLSG